MSRNVKSVEKRKITHCFYLKFLVASLIRSTAEEMEDVTFKGYTRIPTKKLTLSVRRSPCGEGNLNDL